MRTRFRDVVAGLFTALMTLFGGCGGAPEPAEPPVSPTQAEQASAPQASPTPSPTTPEANAANAPNASQAILAWDAADPDRAIDLLLQAAQSGDAELRMLPIVSEAEFAELSQASRDAVMPRILQMDQAWSQLSRAMLVRAGRLDQDGDANEAARLIDTVRRVALANSGDNALLIYKRRNQAILDRL